MGILPYLLLGGTSVILPSGQFDAAQVVDMLEEEGITGCYFVPTQWQQICAVPGVKERNLSLRRISWGASVAVMLVIGVLMTWLILSQARKAAIAISRTCFVWVLEMGAGMRGMEPSLRYLAS